MVRYRPAFISFAFVPKMYITMQKKIESTTILLGRVCMNHVHWSVFCFCFFYSQMCRNTRSEKDTNQNTRSPWTCPPPWSFQISWFQTKWELFTFMEYEGRMTPIYIGQSAGWNIVLKDWLSRGVFILCNWLLFAFTFIFFSYSQFFIYSLRCL